MGFVLSILYFVTYYLTPIAVFGPFAEYRIELILASLVLLVSLPAMMNSFLKKTPQSIALIGLAFAVFLSVLIGVSWTGGAVKAFLSFIPCAFAYFLMCLHCNSVKRLQIVVLMMLLVCLFIITRGSIDLYRGGLSGDVLSSQETESEVIQLWNLHHPYLLAQRSDAREWIYRLRGLGEINDPNDLAQVLVCVIPLVFIFWRQKRTLRNLFCVILPVGALLYGTYLTHSRGALMALLAMAILAARRRIGTVPALLLAIGMFVAASALHFTGGREISANSGAGRMALWGEGLALMKSHPLFGVGFNYMADNAGQTAHNSISVCAAELGIFGLYFWSMFLFPAVRDVLEIASPARVSEGEPPAVEEKLYQSAQGNIEVIDKAEINRLGRLLLLSLTGFLVAGWFLSRAFVMTLFLLGGMVEVVYELALQRGMVAPRLRLSRVMPYAGILAVSLVLGLYILLRVTNFVR